MRSLFEIGEDLEALDALLEELGGDVTAPEAETAIDEWLTALGEERDAKLDRYAHYIAALEADAAAGKAEALKLADRARIRLSRAEFLRDRLADFLRARGLRAVDTPLHRFTVATNGGKAGIRVTVPPADLPDAFRVETVSVRPNLEAIRARLEAGETLDFAAFEERGFHLRIR